MTDDLSTTCCAPAVQASLDVREAERIAAGYRALGDATRLRLLALVAAGDGGEACVCDLTEPVGLSQATVSHHLRLLVEAGLLTRERRGTWSYYSVVTSRLDELGHQLLAVPTPPCGPGPTQTATPETAGVR
ncbi:ArsR/SmtB family transcription factor [Sanguibacter antarcticus]|uniref:ArsR family transcriptional regulator n=1 Tax=Sanguibacter antarcticus TaxID=372484 RepID=A0A2A9E886_9MICO|nr:metalloregulator ArsR/SmtB family transcription factor [Sanguibacter antarcticus]PFG34449.1 ArsR family transcriptional regulator [Sanguibacter antarcticus]